MTQLIPRAASEPRLRAAVPADLGAIEILLTHGNLPLDGVSQILPGFIVAEDGDEIVGVAGVEAYGDAALLRSVTVVSRWRSRGLGRALLARLMGDVEARGVRDLYLLTTTAASYFSGFGFRPVTRAEVPSALLQSVEFQGVCPASATVMHRCLETAQGALSQPAHSTDSPRHVIRGTRRRLLVRAVYSLGRESLAGRLQPAGVKMAE